MRGTHYIMVTCLWLGACTAAGKSDNTTVDSGTPVDTNSVSVSSPSWAEYYHSLYDLKQHSDIAIWGSVSTIIAEQNQPIPENRINVAVRNTVWKHEPNGPMPPSVQFLQTPGGEFDPDAHVGDETIVFLTEYAADSYRVTGGPSGRFDVEHGNVISVVTDGVQVPANVDVTAFQAMIAAAIQPD